MSNSFDIYKFFEKPKSIRRIKNVLHLKFGDLKRIIKIRENEIFNGLEFEDSMLCYGNFIIFFPKKMILLSCILEEVETNPNLQYFKPYLEGNFNDKLITIKYFIERKVCEGATMLILNNTNINSIFNGTELKAINDYDKRYLLTFGIDFLP